jgi:methyltransferase (TIGR00027 family)
LAEPQAGMMTALLTAYARVYHATHDSPVIFDDSLANQLFSGEERLYFDKNLAESLKFLDPERAAACPDQTTMLAAYMHLQGAPIAVSRARYTEDALTIAIDQGIQQYVILGAGMDIFAFRRPELVKSLQVYEIDHPATQAMKRERIAKLGWQIPPQLHFVPVDLIIEDLADALKHSSYDSIKPSFFSWLGVTYYLTREVVFTTLQAVAEIASSGSSIIFDYMDDDAFTPGKVAKRVERMRQIVRNIGEPMKAGFKPSELATELAPLGLSVKEDLAPAEIEKRYFDGRADGMRAFEHVHYAWAVVAPRG